MALRCNNVSHWLGASLESAMHIMVWFTVPLIYFVTEIEMSAIKFVFIYIYIYIYIYRVLHSCYVNIYWITVCIRYDYCDFPEFREMHFRVWSPDICNLYLMANLFSWSDWKQFDIEYPLLRLWCRMYNACHKICKHNSLLRCVYTFS